MGFRHRYALQMVSSMIALGSAAAWGAEPEWPKFRGPDANPVAAKGKLPEKWSKTENVEWTAEIPGRGWSSPIVNGRRVFLTTVETEGKSKPPQIGTEYSNEYVAELMKQGLSEKEVMDKVTARDIELPQEVKLHYFLLCLDHSDRQGDLEAGVPFRPAAGRTASQEQFRFGNSGDRWNAGLCLRREPGALCV